MPLPYARRARLRALPLMKRQLLLKRIVATTRESWHFDREGSALFRLARPATRK